MYFTCCGVSRSEAADRYIEGNNKFPLYRLCCGIGVRARMMYGWVAGMWPITRNITRDYGMTLACPPTATYCILAVDFGDLLLVRIYIHTVVLWSDKSTYTHRLPRTCIHTCIDTKCIIKLRYTRTRRWKLLEWMPSSIGTTTYHTNKNCNNVYLVYA